MVLHSLDTQNQNISNKPVTTAHYIEFTTETDHDVIYNIKLIQNYGKYEILSCIFTRRNTKILDGNLLLL